MRKRSIDHVMKFMRQYASHGTAEKQVARTSRLGMRRTKRAANLVAFYVGERNDLAVGEVGRRQGNGFAGQRRGERFHLAASMECHNHHAAKGVRRRKLIDTPPV